MKTETINLQGIKPGESKELTAERSKNAFYREALGIQLGAEVPRQDGFTLMGTLSPQQLRGGEYLCKYLEGQEDGGETLGTIFQDARNFSELSRQLSMIGDLIQELDALAPEKDFPGRKEARNMLATLSLSLKKVARIAAARPGRIRHFR